MFWDRGGVFGCFVLSDLMQQLPDPRQMYLVSDNKVTLALIVVVFMFWLIGAFICSPCKHIFDRILKTFYVKHVCNFSRIYVQPHISMHSYPHM